MEKITAHGVEVILGVTKLICKPTPQESITPISCRCLNKDGDKYFLDLRSFYLDITDEINNNTFDGMFYVDTPKNRKYIREWAKNEHKLWREAIDKDIVDCKARKLAK